MRLCFADGHRHVLGIYGDTALCAFGYGPNANDTYAALENVTMLNLYGYVKTDDRVVPPFPHTSGTHARCFCQLNMFLSARDASPPGLLFMVASPRPPAAPSAALSPYRPSRSHPLNECCVFVFMSPAQISADLVQTPPRPFYSPNSPRTR